MYYYRYRIRRTTNVLNTNFLCTVPQVSELLVYNQNGKQMVQEGALTALASVADSSQVHLSNYVLDDLNCLYSSSVNCLYSSSVLNDTFLLPVIQ